MIEIHRLADYDYEVVVRGNGETTHRVSIDEHYEQVLMRFLVGRTRVKGVR